MKFAKRIYMIAAVYGLAVLLPQYFLEAKHGLDAPPPITHPEYFYGFIGVAVAWQIAFLIISSDPQRFRPMMIPAILEKATFAPAVFVLYALGRVHLDMVGAAAIDAILGVLFTVAYARTRDSVKA